MNQEWLQTLAAAGFRADSSDFGDPRGELDAVARATVVCPLVDTGIIRASGEDAPGFLHNLLTNDVSGLDAATVRRAGFCTPKGRLLADFLMWRAGEDFLLQLPMELLPAMQKKLTMYVLRSKVKLTDASTGGCVIGLAGSDAAALAAQVCGKAPAVGQQVAFESGQVLGLIGNRFEVVIAAAKAPTLWQQLSAAATPAGLAAWRWSEIAAGDPRIVQATQEQFIPQMINYVQVGGLSFKKGCYPGQEIVARTQYLGKIKRHMLRARLDAGSAVPGDSVYAPETGDQACGTVVSVAPSPQGGSELLAVVQMSCAEAGELHLGNSTGSRLELLELPYSLD